MMEVEAAKAIQVLCGNLGNMKHALAIAIEDAQEPLRAFVTDKEFPLEHRFEAWAEWCDKTHHGHINEADVPLIGKMVDDGEPFHYVNNEEHDWLFFLEIFSADDNEAREICKRYSVTIEDVKELLIEQNFGSFRMDW